MKYIFGALLGIGFFVVLGTFGSMEIGRISDTQGFTQTLIGMGIAAIGFLGLGGLDRASRK